MTVYADYEYYTGTYGGTALTEEDFQPCAVRASLYLDELTLGRAAGAADLDEVKMACCAVAEQIPGLQQAEASAASSGGAVASQKVGSFSVTYQSGASALAAIRATMADVARMYLGRTGLLYRGVPRLWD